MTGLNRQHAIPPTVLGPANKEDIHVQVTHRLKYRTVSMFTLVSVDRVLRNAFGPKIEEVTIDWKRPCKELHGLFSSPAITGVIKDRCDRQSM